MAPASIVASLTSTKLPMCAPSPSRVPGRSRANGPTRAFADMRAGKMGEGVDHRAVLDRHARAEHDIGLDRDILAELGVGRQKDRLRRNHRHARLKRRLAQALLQNGFRFGELRFGVDAAHVVLLGFDRHGLRAHSACDLDRVGQIKFVFAIHSPMRQDRQRLLAGERHQAAIAKADLALFARRPSLVHVDAYRLGGIDGLTGWTSTPRWTTR